MIRAHSDFDSRCFSGDMKMPVSNTVLHGRIAVVFNDVILIK